jgi:hypothetical protein
MKPSEKIKKLIEEWGEHPHVVVLQIAVSNILDEMREEIDRLKEKV